MSTQAKFEKFNQKDGSSGDSSNEKGKMFIGGLSWETTHDNLLRHFTRYGEVVDCVVMKNPETGRSRGFGFITFQDPSNVDLVLQNTPHILDSRTIDPKPCNPRAGMVRTTRRNLNGYKVFLGGLPSNLTETDLRNFFSQYGKVTEVVIMYDQEKKKSRGFGFLTFESEESVDRCCSEHFVNINGKQVEIKKAEPRDTRGGGGMGRGHSGGWDGPGMGMHGGMGPMGGPMMGGGMMGGYQGWGGPGNQGGYGYGPQGGYQGWGPQGQWGGYGGPGGYGPQGSGPQGGPNGGPQGGYGNWNWNGPGPQQGGPQGPGGPQSGGDMYGRGGPSSSSGGPTSGSTPSGPGGAPQKASQETQQYSSGGGSNGGYNGNGYGGSYGVEGNQGYRGGYAQDGSSQGYGAGPGYGNPEGVPPPSGVGSSGAGQGGPGVGLGAGTAGPGGPGPQRGGSYNQPSQSQGYHPYRRGV